MGDFDLASVTAVARAMWLWEAREWERAARELGQLAGEAETDAAWYDDFASHPVTGPEFRRHWEGLATAALGAVADLQRARSAKGDGPGDRAKDPVPAFTPLRQLLRRGEQCTE